MELLTTTPPAKPDDIPLRIYSNPVCPYAQRARLIASAKGVKHEIVEVHLKDKPEWFLELNPLGQVPVIEHNGHIIRESAIAFDYIDEVFGDQKLWPTDSYKKAQSKLILNDFGNMFTSNFYKYYRAGQDENTPLTILKFLKSVETVISQYGGPFIMGDQVSAIDFLIWPWFERVPYVALELSSIFTEEKVPLIMKWLKAMKEVEAVKETYVEGIPKFTEVAKASGGKHDYTSLKINGKNVKIYTK